MKQAKLWCGEQDRHERERTAADYSKRVRRRRARVGQRSVMLGQILAGLVLLITWGITLMLLIG